MGKALAAVAVLCLAGAAPPPPPDIPPTRRDPTVEARFGEAEPDPYRWLEGDVAGDPAVNAWVTAQNTATRRYLDALPDRPAFAALIDKLAAPDRFSLPRRAAGRYFYLAAHGRAAQLALVMRQGVNGREVPLYDPATDRPDGSLAIEDWAPAPDGRHVAVITSEQGSDWRTIRVLDVASRRFSPERLADIRDAGVAWSDDDGFLYAAYPSGAAARGGALLGERAVRWHRIGAMQADDALVWQPAGHPDWRSNVATSWDRRWAIIATQLGTEGKVAVRAIDLARRNENWPIRTLVATPEHDWRFVDVIAGQALFVTDEGAPRRRLVAIDLADPRSTWREIVPMAAGTLERARVIGGRLLLSYNVEGGASAVVVPLRGGPARTLAIGGTGAASGFDGRPDDPETFYRYSSFTRPAGIWRLDLGTGKVAPFAVPRLPFDPAAFVTVQAEARSADGTMVPVTIVRPRDAAKDRKPVPTLLYGYGGFDVTPTPAYSPLRMAWLVSGGAVALASVRGGGEFGAAWHDAGRLAEKHHAFEDFLAAGHWLVDNGVAPPAGLAAQGSSNGGLLVAAAINLEPGLFAAANPDVGVYDMLRFDRFTAGLFWIGDYGRPADRDDWRTLRSYSPYHRVHPGDYPALLVTTGDHDDRVVPAHSFKYIAALQAAATGPRPHLLRVEPGAGHAGPVSRERAVTAWADTIAFLAAWTGLSPPDPARR